MAELTINEASLHYQFDGVEQGQVLVFSNSLGSDLTMWDSVVESLRSRFRILRYDTHGHGQTPASDGPVSIQKLGQDVLALLDALDIPTVSFCGLSMGGLIGQWLAIHHPERIKKLVLCNTAAKIGTPATWNERIKTVRQQGVSVIADAVLDRWLTADFRQANPSKLANLLAMFRNTSPEGYIACCAAIRDADFRADIQRINAPTLIIAGTYDPVTTVTDGAFLQNGISNAKLLELPAAHLSAVEVSDAFAQALHAFLFDEPTSDPDRTTSDRVTYDAGMRVRRDVLGDAHVDRANAGITDFNADFQDFITRYAWGEIWTRPGLPRHSRSLITLGMLIALNREAEFKMHVRAALNNGVTIDEIKEVIMHSALYCGLPAANAAFHWVSDLGLGLCERAAYSTKSEIINPQSEIMKTQVGIIGAGPAGLLLAQLLQQQGIESVVLESRSRERVESRQRAGLLEQGTVDRLRQARAADRLDREGLVHEGVMLSYNGQRHRIDLSELTGGSCVTIYAQTEVVKDLIRLREEIGNPVLFEAQATALEGITSGTPTIQYTHNGENHTLTCDFVAGCDGFHGISRHTIPDSLTTVYDKVYPYSWLGILAQVPPSTDELIYAYHERGFALHSMRSPEISRLYVQCDVTDTVADWPDERIWSELQIRLGTAGWTLLEGPIVEKTITPMRSFVSEPMQYGRLFLAGDSAHIVPPTGAKGLNMAVADTGQLFDALMAWYRDGRSDELENYTACCMRRVWRVQEFSNFMTEMLHHNRDKSAFDQHVQESRFNQLITSQAASAIVAENYVGLAAKRASDVLQS